MKAFATTIMLLSLVGGASAQTTPHSARMKACASEWQAKKHSDAHLKVRYQDFMSSCMKQKATALKASH